MNLQCRLNITLPHSRYRADKKPPSRQSCGCLYKAGAADVR
ncbi:hypothetical protein [Neisseria sp.]